LSGADAVAKLGSAGKAFFHADVKVVRPDGTDASPGEPGEVVIRSDANMVGYWHRDDATATALRDGWLHTSDVASMDADGFVTILDRLTDMIITGGENVYPAEVEDAILAHPGVLEVAVIAQQSARWGESPCAVVVRSDAALSEADVLAWCDGRLARYKQPKSVVFADTIPRNPSGKALKRILRDQYPGPAPE
jgi:acyl-CoA synthetase (AMP-forming)/AMP-acid ligase II